MVKQKPGMIDVGELSALLDMDPSTVRRMAAAGEIPAYKRAGKTSPYKFLFEEVKGALAKNASKRNVK